MHFDKFSFGSIRIDGSTYEYDVVIDRGEIRKRKKKPSKNFVTNSDIRLFRSRKRYHGNAASSSSAPDYIYTCSRIPRRAAQIYVQRAKLMDASDKQRQDCDDKPGLLADCRLHGSCPGFG
jgi:hypothetical protein